MNRVGEIIRKVRHTISRYDMIARGERVVVAVSGGPDSVCLLDLFYRLQDDLGIDLVVAHFDHGLRPSEDGSETRFVESIARSRHLAYETQKADPGLKQGPSLEERAREARYQFLDGTRQKFSAQKIALGHTLNDQAETVLMRLLRGSGLSGLAGIPPIRDGRDVSNDAPRHLRNRIRLDLLPHLMEYQPRILEVLGQTSEIMRKEAHWQAEEAEAWMDDGVLVGDRGEMEIALPRFLNLPEAMRNHVIRHVLGKMRGDLRGVGFRHVAAINRMAVGKRPQGHVNLPNHLTARRVYDTLVFTEKDVRETKGFWFPLEMPGTFHLKALGRDISLEELPRAEAQEVDASPWTAYLDAHKLAYPLVVRNFRQGDRFVPLGMTGHKKLKDFFIDLKIPRADRKRIPILTYEDMPVWVCGYRIDNRFRMGPGTERILKVTFSK
jgi:tRNA(Ile)-lysidine synthase